MRFGIKLSVMVVGCASVAGLILVLSPQTKPFRQDADIRTPHSKRADMVNIVKEKVGIRPAAALVIGIKLPPNTTVISSSEKTTGRFKRTIVKLESWASPADLQIYFTDLLLKDWMIMRDDLTPEVGWSGVFLQIEPIDRNLGIFTVVHKMGVPSGRSNPTRITIMAGEAAK